MKRIIYVMVLLLCFFSLPSFADTYRITFSLRHLYYPGEKISFKGYIYCSDSTGSHDEDINLKIYKIPADLPADKYKDYSLQSAPVKEINKSVTMKSSDNHYYRGDFVLNLPELSSGVYYLVASTAKDSVSSSIRISTIALSAKISKDMLLLSIQDRKNSSPLKGDIKLFAGNESRNYSTDKNGILNINLNGFKNGAQCRILAMCNDDTCEINFRLPDSRPGFMAYIYTDRPVYRPSQKVFFKGTIRYEKNGKLEYVAGEDMKISIKDAKNSEIYKKNIKTDDYGAISGDITLSEEPPLGTYRIICTATDGQTKEGTFLVEEYRKPEFKITVTPDKAHYIKGDTMTFNIDGKYYFGAPVPEKEYKWQIYRDYYYPSFWNNWWEEEIFTENSIDAYERQELKTGQGKTDKNGKGSFSFPAEDINYDANYTVVVTMADESRREVTGITKILITGASFYFIITQDRYVYNPGERGSLKIEAKDYQGNPIETDFTLDFNYENYDKEKKKWKWKTIESARLKTDSRGSVSYDFVPEKEGYYQVICRAKDQNHNKVKKSIELYSYGGTDYYNWNNLNKVDIIPDKHIYEPGDTAYFLIVCPYEGIKAFLTVEGHDILDYRIIDLSNKTACYKVKITDKHTPDFYVSVNFFRNGKFYTQSKKIICPPDDKFLTVSLEPDKKEYRPRENGKFIIKTLDRNKRPVSSQVSFGLTDESVYAVAGETVPDIQKFFYGARGNSISTYNSLRNSSDEMSGEYGLDSDLQAGAIDEDNIEGGTIDDSDSYVVQPDFTREYFPDTAYFNPSIITDQNGRAEVNLSFPDSLTTWRATARAVSKDTKAGEKTGNVIVTKDLLARLIMPRFFTERDETVITGIVHNYLNSEKTVYAKLEIDGGIEFIDKNKQQCKIQVLPDGSATIDWKVRVKKQGPCEVKLIALTDEESDAVEMTVPVLPHGTEQTAAISGVTKDKAEEEITLPDNAEKDSSKCVIMLEPSLSSSLLSSLEYLTGYPYGCVEQTMSRFLPSVIVAKTLKELNLQNEHINKELPEMVRAGFQRLYNFQHSDGGWGWWARDKSHPFMTAYVVYGMSLAKSAGYEVDEKRLKHGIKWLKNNYGGEKDINTKVYMVFSLVTAGVDCREWLMALYDEYETLNPYSMAVFSLSLKKAGLQKEAKNVIEILETTAETGETTASWPGGYGWTENRVESTSYCLMALISVKPESKLIPSIVKYLSLKRKGNSWYSTKDTASAVMAVTEYVKITKELNPDFNGNLYVNGKKISSFKFTRDDTGTSGKKIEIPLVGGLISGANKIKFEMKGSGLLYYNVYLTYYTDEEQIMPADSGFNITRKFYLIEPGRPSDEKKEIPVNDRGEMEVKSNDLILEELEISGYQDSEYLVIEDPRPAGCEYVPDMIEGYSPDEKWDYWFTHRELRDEKCVSFTTYYHGDLSKITCKLRAETPGIFHVMPARAYLMYTGEVYGNSDEAIINISDNKEKIGPAPVPVTISEMRKFNPSVKIEEKKIENSISLKTLLVVI
ncbi:MAG: MG2 domain-containing protein, partial [Candidatus Eremiobacterota bacterium]